MTLIGSLGALLKYELHQIGHRDAAVLVSLTPQEWENFQKSTSAAEASPLKDVASSAISTAHVVPQSNGTVAVQFSAGDYAKLKDAQAAEVPKVEPASEPTAEPDKGPAEPEKKAEGEQKDTA